MTRKIIIPGVGPDAPAMVNERGGRQSTSPYRADLFPPLAYLEVCKVLKTGAERHGEDNWRNISTREHLNHVLIHLKCWLAGDKQDNHLGHMACRAMMALEIDLTGDSPPLLPMSQTKAG